jgi:hypothetical protein
VTGFFKRGDRLERELRAARPRPGAELVNSIEARVREERPARRRSSYRIAVPIVVTAALAAALASVGGVSYAASSIANAAETVAKVFVPAKQTKPVVLSGLTSGGDQYQEGYQFGDADHNHEGPPGLKKKGGAFAPPLTPKIEGKTAKVATSFTIDEQAHLFISVVDSKGKKLTIAQSKSKVGSGLKGAAPVKTIDYLVLVPRTIPLNLAVPANLLAPGKTYKIQIIARDPQGNKSTLLVPFKG